MDRQPENRRELARRLTRILDASPADTLRGLSELPAGSAVRIGVTGPPGAGKSTLVCRLAEQRLADARRIGILAIDPTSPISRGSLLGDRVRMESIAQHPGVYVRSLPTRRTHDGLCDNAADLLLTMEAFGFDDILLETVGVGQTDVAVRILVDTVVLVLVPESGDTIQAMKAGILETADVLVVNKADLPGAQRIKAEVETIMRRRNKPDDWRPPVVMASAAKGTGIGDLDDAIKRHGDWLRQHRDPDFVRRERTKYLVQSLIGRRVTELLEDASPDLFAGDLQDAHDAVLHRLLETTAQPH